MNSTKSIEIPNTPNKNKQRREDLTESRQYYFQAYGCIAGFCHLNSTLKVPEDRIIHNDLCFQRPNTLSGTTPGANSHV